MAHPYGHGSRQTLEKRVLRGVLVNDGVTVFALLALLHRAAKRVRQQLHAVADAEDGDAAGQHVGGELRRARLEDAGGATGEDEPLDVQVRQLLFRHVVGVDLAVDVGLAHSAGDEAAKLGAEVEHDDSLVAALGGLAGSRGLPEILLSDFQVRGDLDVAGSGYPVARWTPASGSHNPLCGNRNGVCGKRSIARRLRLRATRPFSAITGHAGTRVQRGFELN